jgi:hypothetical protein
MEHIVFAGSCYLLIFGLVMHTSGTLNKIIFKVLPFGLGIANLIVAGKMYAWF